MTTKPVFLAAVCLCLIWAGQVSAMQSTNYKITASVMSSGGGTMTSASFVSNAVLGQPSPIADQDETPVSASYDLYPGYLYTLVSGSFCGWDLNPSDGDVDGLDLYLFIDGFDVTEYIEDFSGEFGRTGCQ